MKVRWFTLVELLIVMVIVGILITLVFQTYSEISKLSFRIEQEKILEEESIYFSQILQNLSERNTIDWDKYDTNLVNNNWFTGTLYMTGLDGAFSLYSTWSCKDDVVQVFNKSYDKNWCWIEMKTDDENKTIALTETWNVFVTNTMFRIVPFASEDEIIKDNNLCKTNYFACLHSEWFWIFTSLQIPNYSETWANDVKQNMQLFFNLWL